MPPLAPVEKKTLRLINMLLVVLTLDATTIVDVEYGTDPLRSGDERRIDR